MLHFWLLSVTPKRCCLRSPVTRRTNGLFRDRSFITSQGGGGFGGGEQFLKRVNFWGSVLKMYKV